MTMAAQTVLSIRRELFVLSRDYSSIFHQYLNVHIPNVIYDDGVMRRYDIP